MQTYRHKFMTQFALEIHMWEENFKPVIFCCGLALSNLAVIYLLYVSEKQDFSALLQIFGIKMIFFRISYCADDKAEKRFFSFIAKVIMNINSITINYVMLFFEHQVLNFV